MADDEPTYLETTWSALPLHLCLLCAHQAFDPEVFTRHMASFHDGVMRSAATGPGPEATGAVAVEAPAAPAAEGG